MTVTVTVTCSDGGLEETIGRLIDRELNAIRYSLYALKHGQEKLEKELKVVRKKKAKGKAKKGKR